MTAWKRALAGGAVGLPVGALVGALAGVPMMLWGPGSDDPLAGLWVVMGGFLTILPGGLAGAFVGWQSARAPARRRTMLVAAAIGAAASAVLALSLFREETLDEAGNLLVLAGMGALAGVAVAWLHAAGRDRPGRGARARGGRID
jgi:hypothetical protein